MTRRVWIVLRPDGKPAVEFMWMTKREAKSFIGNIHNMEKRGYRIVRATLEWSETRMGAEITADEIRAIQADVLERVAEWHKKQADGWRFQVEERKKLDPTYNWVSSCENFHLESVIHFRSEAEKLRKP